MTFFLLFFFFDKAERKAQLDSKMKNNREKRKAQQQHKQEERISEKDPSELADLFVRQFREKSLLIDTNFEHASSSGDQQILAQNVEELQLLQKQLSEATLFLSPYDIRQLQQVR